MEAVGTDTARATMLRLAVTRVPRDDLKAALARTSDPSFRTPTAVGNALNALRRHRDPAAVVDRPQYRAALPYLAASIADECLARTIEVLGDDSDDPTRPQLLEALDQVGAAFSDTTIAVMLAYVAHDEMPSSALCFELLDDDPRFGLTGWSSLPAAPSVPTAGNGGEATPEQRRARRAKREKAAAARRRQAEVGRRADERVRRARKAERSRDRSPADGPPVPARDGEQTGSPPARRATLTPVEATEFDDGDPWVSAVVFAWVPFDSGDPPGGEPSGTDGKARRCVVVAGSPTHLLVRPGYSEGGMKSRDWKTVPMRSWSQAGFERPTWIDVHSVRTPRSEVGAPVGWLTREDWNALW